MSVRFALDVDAVAVAGAARELGDFAEPMTRSGSRVSAVPASFSATWRGNAAASAVREATALGTRLTAAAPRFGQAAEALRRLATYYAHATDVAIPDLNRRWAAAESNHATATDAAQRGRRAVVADIAPGTPDNIRSLQVRNYDERLQEDLAAATAALHRAQDGLQAEYDELVRSLDEQTRVASSALAEAVVVPVPAVAIGAFGGWGFFGDFLTDLVEPSAFGGFPDLALADLAAELQQPPHDVDALLALLTRARAAGLAPRDYRAALAAYWQAVALRDAGIDLSVWDPAAGADANRAIIEAVYRYYGDLFLRHPELEWAGMANMIGPSFAGGFFDLAMFRRITGDLANIPEPFRSELPPGFTELAQMSSEEFHWYENRLLTMQRDIFMDQGMMHAAYEHGGVAAIDELYAAGVIGDPATAQAWHDIDIGHRTGNAALVHAGNKALLYREQYQIIATSYDDMRTHSPTGGAMTWLMTTVGAPSIPGARSFAEVFPLVVEVETPGPEEIGLLGLVDTANPLPIRDLIPGDFNWRVDNPAQGTVTITTPLPDGNISHRDQRWALIEQDTLPAYLDLLENDPAAARALISMPVADRIEHYRIDETWDDTLRRLLEWRVDVDQ